jgi:zeaxanthin glucosyltransferase
MAKIALVCPPLPGHLNPMFALGRALQRRGHSAIFFHIPAIGDAVRAQGLGFEPIGGIETDRLAASIAEMAVARGLRSLKFAVECARKTAELLCGELPAAFQKAQVDLVLADQNEPAAASVAEHLGLKYISVCPSLPLNREPNIPPPFVPWTSYWPGAWGRLRNRVAYRLSDLLIAPINRTLNRYRRSWGLRPISEPDETFSPWAQLSQMVRELDFPRRELPKTFHYVGPFLDAEAPAVPFPFEQLNGKPLIYASIGTLQDPNSRHFHVIAEACAGLDAQLVIATGRDTALQGLAGSPLVVKYAPQLELLSRARLTITHAGMNTVMQSLAFGVPMVALPITHDQPAIAARVAWSGAGMAMPIESITAGKLRGAVTRVMETPIYRTRAEALSKSIKAAGGVERAADIVEKVIGS